MIAVLDVAGISKDFVYRTAQVKSAPLGFFKDSAIPRKVSARRT